LHTQKTADWVISGLKLEGAFPGALPLALIIRPFGANRVSPNGAILMQPGAPPLASPNGAD